MDIRELADIIESQYGPTYGPKALPRLYSGGKEVQSVEILVAGPDGQGVEIVFNTQAVE